MKNEVFLGGTCNNSTWRDELIPLLKVEYFNPVVKDWNEEAQKLEVEKRESCDFVLYVITPEMKGVYSIAEIVDDSNKRPDKTIFCVLEKVTVGEEEIAFEDFQIKSLNQVKKMVEENGATVLSSLEEIADHLNNQPNEVQEKMITSLYKWKIYKNKVIK